MELANPIYPMRSVIRCKAKQQLMLDTDVMVNQDSSLRKNGASPSEFWGGDEFLDVKLFNELAITLFRSERCEVLYQPCHSQAEACLIEDWIAMELATTYRRIIQQRQSPVVQALNVLLNYPSAPQ
jgi:hypothetical protein